MEANKNPITPEEFSAKLMKMASERFMSVEILNDETNQPEKRIKIYFDGRIEGNAKIGNKGTLFGIVHSFAVDMYKDLYSKHINNAFTLDVQSRQTKHTYMGENNELRPWAPLMQRMMNGEILNPEELEEFFKLYSTEKYAGVTIRDPETKEDIYRIRLYFDENLGREGADENMVIVNQFPSIMWHVRHEYKKLYEVYEKLKNDKSI